MNLKEIQILLFFFIFTIFGQNESRFGNNSRLKVLVYSHSLGWSHMQFSGKIADILAEAGHEIHFAKLMVNPAFSKRNETKFAYKIHRFYPKHISPDQLEIAQRMLSNMDSFSGQHFHMFSFMDFNIHQMVDVVLDSCRALLENDELIGALAKENFDVAIAESFDSCPFAMFHQIGARISLGTLAIPLAQVVARQCGIPTFASFVPDPFAYIPHNSPEMTFWERALNLCNFIHNWIVWPGIVQNDERKLIEKAFGPKFPSDNELLKNISLLFVNSNPFMEFPRPISNKVIYIGGIVNDEDAKNSRAFELKMQPILDNSKGGAVLVSFGSIADTRKMGKQMREGMLRAFGKFPDVQFIWKFHNQTADEQKGEEGEMGQYKNVHKFDWLDQTAILRHPNVRAFVSHCGRNSLNEASRAGVPIVAIPLFADQLFNSVLTKHKGIGVMLDVRELNGPNAEELMVKALEKVLFNEEFQLNAKMLAKKQELTPFSAKEQLIRWVEFAAKFPSLGELNLPGDNELGWFVYYSMDVIMAFICICAFIILGASILLRAIWRRLIIGARMERRRREFLERKKMN